MDGRSPAGELDRESPQLGEIDVPGQRALAHTPTRNRRSTDLDETSDRNGAPATPADLRPRGWFSVLKRTVTEFRDDNLTDWAAALTYYTVLSVFPALIALVSIVGLAGQNPQTTNALLKIIDDIGPSSAVDTSPCAPSRSTSAPASRS